MPIQNIHLIAIAVGKIPHLVGLQFYTDEYESSSKLDQFRYLFEGNVKILDIRFGRSIAMRYNYLHFDLEILGK